MVISQQKKRKRGLTHRTDKGRKKETTNTRNPRSQPCQGTLKFVTRRPRGDTHIFAHSSKLIVLFPSFSFSAKLACALYLVVWEASKFSLKEAMW